MLSEGDPKADTVFALKEGESFFSGYPGPHTKMITL